MEWRKELQVVGDRAQHACLITLLQLKNLCKAKRISPAAYPLGFAQYVRETARETGIHRSTVHRIIKKNLTLKCIKKKQVQDLTEANKKARLVRAWQLLRCYPDHMVKFIWFSDEKLFSVAAPVITK